MDDRYDNYAGNPPNRPAVRSAAMLAEKAMQAVRASLEENVQRLGGSTHLMPASTVGSSYNNPQNSRGGLERNNANNLELRGLEYRSQPQGQLGFPAEGRGVSGWGENSLEEHGVFRSGNGIQQEPMWPNDGYDERIDPYQYITHGDEDHGFQNEQSRFRGMYDNYASNVERVDRRYDNNFYPPEQYESAGGFASDSRDNYQRLEPVEDESDDRNFPARQFDGYGRGRGGPGSGPELEGFGPGQPTRFSQDGNSIRQEQMIHPGREQEQQAAVSNKRGIAEHNRGGFNQFGTKTSGNNDGSQVNTVRETGNASNRSQQQTNLETANEDEAQEEDDGEDSSFCKLCSMPFDSSEKYFRHTRGLLHTQRKMAADAQMKGIKLEPAPEPYKPPPKPQLAPAAEQPEKKTDTSSVQRQPAASTSSGLAMIANEKGDDEDDEEDWDEDEEDDGLASKEDEQGEFHCMLCDIATTGAVSLRSHLNGRNHKLVADAVANGTAIPRRLASKLGPKAQVPKSQKPMSLPKMVPGSGPSILLEVLKNVPEAIVGLKQVKEYQLGRQPTFYCITCDSHCDSSSIQTHLIGSKHRMKHLRDAHPDVYQHVKTHGGKKSQLSAFLEEVCTDIEKKEGRGQPILETAADGDKEGGKATGDKPAEKAGDNKPAEKAGDKPAEKAGEKKAVTGFKDDRMESGPPTHLRHLPHEVVIARYKEDKRRKEMMEQGLNQDGYGWGRDGPGFRPDWRETGPAFRPDWHEAGPAFDRGRGGRGPWNWDEFDPRRPGPDFDRRPGPDFDRRPGPDFDRRPGPDFDRRPGPDFDRRPGPDFDRRPGPDFDRRPGPDFDRHPGPDFDRHPGPDYGRDFGPMAFERGGPFQNQGRFPPFEQEWRGGPGHLPPAPMHRMVPPLPPWSEEESYRRMYAYERHNFFYPEVGISPDEARSRMFYEYDQLGIPYKVACDRVLVQENRRMRLLELIRDGIDFDDACNRVIAAENRRQLIREYERQGLTTREAKYRVIVEEERRKLFEDYEQKGISPQEARKKIMAGDDRMHLIREYERHGIPPEIALERAIAEEVRFRNFEESLMRGQGERSLGSSRDNELDDIAERNMLETYMEQGIGREEAENKAIALLRQQGVPIQEAVKRVRSIVTKLKEKRDCDNNLDRSPEQGRDDKTRREKSPDDNRLTKRERNRDGEVGGGMSSRERDRDDEDDRVSSQRRRDSLEFSASQQSGERSQTKSKKDDLDDITPEEAKERLLKEYEKRGISREEACKALIAELIRSGIPPDEAERRFSNTKSRSGPRSKCDVRQRSRSPVGQPPHQHSPIEDRSLPLRYARDAQVSSGTEMDRHYAAEGRSLTSRYPDSSNKSIGLKDSRSLGRLEKEDRNLTRQDRNNHSGGALGAKYERSRDSLEGQGQKNKQPAEQKEPFFRPTLTLGEELRMKRKRETLLTEGLNAVRLKLPKLLDFNLSSSSLPKPPTATATAAEAAKSQPAQTSLPLTKPQVASTSGDGKMDVSNLFESLTSNLISSEDDAAMALQVSKALTSALLKYRLKPVADEVQASKSSDKSFVEKRIEDAKKLFQTKMTASGSQFPQTQVNQAYAISSDSRASAGNKAQLQPQQPRAGDRQPEVASSSGRNQVENFGLPPRKSRVTFDPNTVAQEASQRAAWPQNKEPPPPPPPLQTRRIQNFPLQNTTKMQNAPPQKPPSSQQLADAGGARQPADPKRLLYEAQRQQRLERLSSITQQAQSGANHSIVVKSQNLGSKSKK